MLGLLRKTTTGILPNCNMSRGLIGQLSLAVKVAAELSTNEVGAEQTGRA